MDPLGVLPLAQARRFIGEQKPDIVHFSESYDFRCLLLMLLCPGVPFVTTVHDPIPHAGERISLQKFKHWVRDRIRLRSHGLIVHGQGLRDVLSEYSGIPIGRIYFVPHGEYRYYTYFDQKHPEPSNGHKNILFFGRWEDYKGIDVLIDAEPLIADRVPNVRIILAGEGRLTLADLQPRMVNPDHFEIRNYAIPDDEVPSLFRRADVVVLPYRQATQSGPLHIAAMLARPLVASAVGAMSEVIEDGETGVLVPPGNPEALAQAVCRILENPLEALRLGRSAQERMARQGSLERVAQIQSEVYQQVIETHKVETDARGRSKR